MSSNQVFFVLGPTASGKSAWALAQAEKNNGIIVNADSIQFYKHLNIGSAKPSAADRKRVPHYLFDMVTPDQDFTAGDYFRAARALIAESIGAHNIYVVGGSGFYIQALEKGLYEIPPIPENISKQVESIDTTLAVYEELLKYDAKAAQKIGPTDPYRLRRALAVFLTTGLTMAAIELDFQKKHKKLSDMYSLKKYGVEISRDELRKRVVDRTQQMLAAGLIAEVEELVRAGYRECKVLSSVGYKECLLYLDKKISRQELAEKIVTSTMQLAKRQRTWFKRDLDIRWLSSLDLVHKQES